ncbi:MAG: cation-transporting P-type ATPase [Candidatus Abyssubacteria bacterium]
MAVTPKKEHTNTDLPASPWSRPLEEILQELRVTPEQGLTESDVKQRRKQYGPNKLRETKPISAWLILLNQFKSLMIALLVAACIVAFAFGEWVEGIAIGAVILINTAIGFFTEIGAVRSMEALRQLTSVSAKVRRGGQVKEIPAEELVPGDIVILEGGDIVTADLRLITASKLQADESPLTGESVPVGKNTEPVEHDTPLAERKNMLFKGTALTRGSAEGVVVATGMETELGEISELAERAEEERTPLEKRLDNMSAKLIWVTLVIAVVVAVSGIFAGKEIFLMIETAIALAVAAVPEGLPIVATIALARGMWRMARRNALINKLAAVETLGATNVIFTDKTGTLTENRMTVAELHYSDATLKVGEREFSKDGEAINPSTDPLLREALEVGALCNNASLQDNGENLKGIGDPMEVALLIAGAKAGIARPDLVENLPEVREEAFDPDTRMMATFHKADGRYRVAVKGAPEAVLSQCIRIRTPEGENELTEQQREEWLERTNQMAGKGLRTLALATKNTDSTDAKPYEGLTFLALVGLLDPPRSDVRQAIASCQNAGIRVIMVTGDQPVTARNIAEAVGLINGKADVVQGKELKSAEQLTEEEKKRLIRANIFARVSPKQKLDLIEIHQKENAVVAMTGDGVNDAPALKKADIGVAMGLRGTQVAREAADMVLKDDAFSTIVTAIQQGRVIFDNIRKFILFLLSCNVSEVMVVSFASLVNAPLPILPLQILFLNLITDVFPALALGVGEGDPDVMKRRPRDPREPILALSHWIAIGGYGLLITASVLTAFALAFVWLDAGRSGAVTISFLTLAFAQLWHVFNMRDANSRFFRNDITRNPYVWGALILCIGLLLMATYLPGLADVLQLAAPGANGWTLIIVMSLVPYVVGQILKSLGIGSL